MLLSSFWTFTKAFDKVAHQSVTLILENRGFTAKIKDWIVEWLCEICR